MAQTRGLTRIAVDGLFDESARSYELDLEAEQPTVLTGANGTGKSTLLRLVKAAATADFWALANAPLREFRLIFGDGAEFQLKRARGGQGGTVGWRGNVHEIDVQLMLDLPEWTIDFVGILDSQVARREFSAVANRNGLDYQEMLRMRQRVARVDVSEVSKGPSWYESFQNRLKVVWISDQRLVVESRRRSIPVAPGEESQVTTELAVRSASDRLAEQMRFLDSEYTRQSQLQDRRFPNELVAALTAGSENLVPLEILEEEVEARRERLRSVGLISSSVPFREEIRSGSLDDERVRPVMRVFWTLTLRKIEVLEPLAAKLIAFKNFLDSQLLGKKVGFSRRDGIRFSVARGRTIRPEQLSSGEQQMMVLAYEILFRAEEGALVIVDEPEMSLHVLWQDSLLDNLTAMGRANKLQFLMATHSPSLIASHPEVERSLDLFDA